MFHFITPYLVMEVKIFILKHGDLVRELTILKFIRIQFGNTTLVPRPSDRQTYLISTHGQLQTLSGTMTSLTFDMVSTHSLIFKTLNLFYLCYLLSHSLTAHLTSSIFTGWVFCWFFLLKNLIQNVNFLRKRNLHIV